MKEKVVIYCKRTLKDVYLIKDLFKNSKEKIVYQKMLIWRENQ